MVYGRLGLGSGWGLRLKDRWMVVWSCVWDVGGMWMEIYNDMDTTVRLRPNE
jgi:hypothetical protein